jgi:hypothetical protein
MELRDPVGKQFKRKHPDKHEERVVCRLDTVTTVQHQDLILCEAVLEFDENEFEAHEFEACEPPASASSIHSPLARRRAGQRWSALVTAPSSRIARIMRPVLDEACWAAFVAHANAHYRATFLAAFNGPLLRCVGRVGGAPCPRDAAVDLAAPDAANCLAHLHLDHEQDLQITCDMWKAALPPSPAAWDDGINGPLLCHLLFGVRNDHYDYAMVNKLLPISMKTFVKKCACYPEHVTAADFASFSLLQDDEKVHIVFLVAEARRQAVLLFALRAVMRFMTDSAA